MVFHDKKITGGPTKSMNLVEEMPLPNNLVVEIWDKSREIAADTTQVKLIVKIKVEMKKEYFSDPEHFDQVMKVFGPEIYYEYEKERTFVNKEDKEKVFNELSDAFKKDTLPYIAKSNFPSRFALSKHRDIQNNFYKYRHLLSKEG